MTVGQLHYLIHTRLALDDGEKLVFLVDGKSGIPNATTPMETLYKVTFWHFLNFFLQLFSYNQSNVSGKIFR